jgi:hypothetical protein
LPLLPNELDFYLWIYWTSSGNLFL